MDARRLLIASVVALSSSLHACSQEVAPNSDELYATGGRDGVAFESCLLSDGRPIQHFVLFDRGNFAVVATEEWTMSLDAEDGVGDGIDMYEFANDVECQGGVCSTVEHIYRVGSDEAEDVSLTWTARRVNDEMDVLIFEIENGPRASCAAFPVKGPVCRSVLDKLRDFVSRHNLDASALRLSDAWCE